MFINILYIRKQSFYFFIISLIILDCSKENLSPKLLKKYEYQII